MTTVLTTTTEKTGGISGEESSEYHRELRIKVLNGAKKVKNNSRIRLGDLVHLFGGSLSIPNIRCDTSTFLFNVFLEIGQNCGLTTVLTTTVRISFSASNSISGCGPVGRALDLGSRCREFESPHSDQKPESALQVLAFLCL